jgi:ABC-type lipoprotein release transport system permease subunit
MNPTLTSKPPDSPRPEHPSPIRKHRALFLNAAKGLGRNPVRNGLIVLCLTALLSPLVTGIAICEGIKMQYRAALQAGADVYVARDHYGSNAPIELDMVEKLKDIQGVTRVVPRVVGRTYVKDKCLAILGVDVSSFPASIRIHEGRKPSAKGEVIIGRRAAEYLKIALGTRFSIQRSPDQIFQVVGIFQSEFNIWNADLLLMGFEDAARLYGLAGRATDLMVYTRPGYEQIVDIIARMSQEDAQGGEPPLRVQNKELVDRYSQRGFNIKAGVFAGFYCLVLALGIPSVGVISGFGLSERRQEVGVMKALGWQTQEVLEMVALENLLVGMVSMPFVMLVAAGWIHLLNGALIARFFVASFNVVAPFSVPARLFPVACFIGILMAMILAMVGSIYSTWKTAIVPPQEAMKM